jgi:hypothetical protein
LVDRDRTYETPKLKEVMTVDKLRVGTRRDVIEPRDARERYSGHHTSSEGMGPEEVVGKLGMELSWPRGEVWSRWRGYYESDKRCRVWLPLGRVFNMDAYELDEYKNFLCDRSLKGQYLEWAPALLTSEDYKRRIAKGMTPEKSAEKANAND